MPSVPSKIPGTSEGGFKITSVLVRGSTCGLRVRFSPRQLVAVTVCAPGVTGTLASCICPCSVSLLGGSTCASTDTV